MKYKTTRKAIVNGSVNVKCAGYCDLQNLLRNHSAVAYVDRFTGETPTAETLGTIRQYDYKYMEV